MGHPDAISQVLFLAVTPRRDDGIPPSALLAPSSLSRTPPRSFFSYEFSRITDSAWHATGVAGTSYAVDCIHKTKFRGPVTAGAGCALRGQRCSRDTAESLARKKSLLHNNNRVKQEPCAFIVTRGGTTFPRRCVRCG